MISSAKKIWKLENINNIIQTSPLTRYDGSLNDCFYIMSIIKNNFVSIAVFAPYHLSPLNRSPYSILNDQLNIVFLANASNNQS